MIKILKSEEPLQCDACHETGKVITRLSFDNGMAELHVYLSDECIRELTKELTSNKYLNSDKYLNTICK